MNQRLRFAANFAMTVVAVAAFGWLIPLTLTHRITLIGLVVSLGGFSLGLFAAANVGKHFGVLPAIAVFAACNIAIAVFWVWFVLRITKALQRAKEHPAA